MKQPVDDRIIYIRHVPPDLHRLIRLKAAEEDRSMSDLAIDALRMYVKRPSGAAPRLRER